MLKPILVLGRRPECDITIPCPTVSSRHCLLEFKEGLWWVRDLESKNGTAVNGQKNAQMKIGPNSILSVGRQRMVVDYQLTKTSVKSTLVSDPDEEMAFELLSVEPSNSPSPSASLNPPGEQNVSRPASNVNAGVPTEKLDNPFGCDLGKLIPCGGGAPIPLRSEELILGRGRECDVRIRYPSVSSRHCKLRFDQGYWLVEDLNSSNGTWVDGDRCLLDCLMPESVLALDKHRFTIHYSPRGAGPPPAVRRLFTQSLLEKAGLANEFSGDRLGGMKLPDDDLDRPKRYDLLDSDDESL